MSNSVRFGAVVTLVAGGLLSSCARAPRDPAVDPHILTDAEPPININFTCGNANQGIQVTLVDNNNNPAWTFKAHKNDPVSWLVPGNVTINAISSKSATNPLPVLPDGDAGGSDGKPYKVKVKDNVHINDKYSYNIDVTCTPAPGKGPPVRLVIDPDMIIF